MWELSTSTSHGRATSVRSILTYVLATFIAALLWITFTPSNTYAADVSWSGNSALIYNDNTYSGPADAQMVEDLGLLEGTTVFTFIDPVTATDRKIHVIYFAPGADPGTANQANYRTYDYSGEGDYTNGSTMTPVEIEPQAGATAGTSSCEVDGGLGWIICPITNTLAGWMDWVFDVLASFLEVKPLETDNNSAMHRMWSYMRTIANIAFVIAFLIIIYSQVTSFGVSNYGIKKLLPRIIVAAILVNVSYIICALAIDISNTLGYSLQDIFLELRNTTVGTEGNSWESPSWSSVATFVLTGGAAGIAGSVIAMGQIATFGVVGSLALLLPALLTFLFAVLVALVIMAARQALITILTILSPLAFVAFLLPNTEKWFEKWRSLFMTMLVLFPAFSVIFGGSQLAGSIIIQNANSINVIILGMIVQVAPLFITPMLIKLSGNLLSRIAGFVNDPNKGLIDRTRNWSKDRAENIKARRLGTQAKAGFAGISQRAGQRMDHNRRRREGWRNAHGAMADASWANTRDFSNIDQANRQAADSKTLGETNSAIRFNQSKLDNAEIRQLDVDVRSAKLNLENAELDATIENWDRNHTTPVAESRLLQRTLKDIQSGLHKDHDADYEEIKAGKTPEYLAHTPNVISYSALARDALTSTKIATDRANNALTEQAGQYAQLLQSDSAIAETAGGIRGIQGYQSVLASAKKTASKFLLDDIQNIQETMDYALATDVTELHSKFSSATTMAERVAYAKAAAKNGGPGITMLRTMIKEYEGSNDTAFGDLLDFKELVGTEASIRTAGKDIEFWLNNSKNEATNTIKTFDEISEDISTWTNLSANAFAGQNVSTHHYALGLLYEKDKNGYQGVIDMIRNNPGALAQVKQGIRERFAIYSDQELAEAARRNITLRSPGTLKPDDKLLEEDS